MAHHFLFLCPVCRAEDSIQHFRCKVCHTQFRLKADLLIFENRQWSFSDYFRWVGENLKIQQETYLIKEKLQRFSGEEPEDVVRVSCEATLRQGLNKVKISGLLQLYERELEMPKHIDNGLLIITNGNCIFKGSVKEYAFSFQNITCVTTNARYFEFKVKGKPYYQLDFKYESSLKYEILFRKLLSNYYTQTGKKPIEYQPRLIFSPRRYTNANILFDSQTKSDLLFPARIIRSVLLGILRLFFRIFLKIEIVGGETLSLYSPFICVLNHQSIFDPFIILAFLYRRIGFLTKSTSFSSRTERYFLKLGLSLPTTRYQTDPAVIRHIFNYLKMGIPIGIFPEGERSWDGQLQLFKYSVIRMLVYAKCPVIPIVIDNTFSFMPRWAKFPRRQNIHIEVLPAFCFVPNLFSQEEYKNYLESFFQKEIDPAK
jgi:1-acyl-sn-glycerol-3-phosphate acyltransferase